MTRILNKQTRRLRRSEANKKGRQREESEDKQSSRKNTKIRQLDKYTPRETDKLITDRQAST